MGATVVIAERNGISLGTETLGISNLNFGSTDAPNLTPAASPITAQANGCSYEKWERLLVSALGSSSLVDNIRVWISNLGGGYVVGEGMVTNLRSGGWINSPYQAPVQTPSTIATQTMPTALPSVNCGIGGLLSGSITSTPGYSDYFVLQMTVTASTPAGNVNQKTITIQWDEQ